MAYSADEELLGSIDLSKATGLRDAVLKWKWAPQWVAATLRTIKHDHRNLQQISLETHWEIYAKYINAGDSANLMRSVMGETIYQGWLELDEALVQLWESHSIRSELVYIVLGGEDKGREAKYWIESLLLESKTRGAVDLIERRMGG